MYAQGKVSIAASNAQEKLTFSGGNKCLRQKHVIGEKRTVKGVDSRRRLKVQERRQVIERLIEKTEKVRAVMMSGKAT